MERSDNLVAAHQQGRRNGMKNLESKWKGSYKRSGCFDGPGRKPYRTIREYRDLLTTQADRRNGEFS
jgi:hypothetical protein